MQHGVETDTNEIQDWAIHANKRFKMAIQTERLKIERQEQKGQMVAKYTKMKFENQKEF